MGLIILIRITQESKPN